MIEFDLKGTPHTLIIPLAGRANSRLLFPKEEFDDPSARRAMEKLSYKNPFITKNPLVVKGSVGRALAFQQEAEYFLKQNPQAQVVCLGCGLSDYFQWLDNGNIHWVDVDLPEVMKIREQLLSFENDRHQSLVGSILDDDFFDRLNLSPDRPTLFLCEGVLMYLHPEQVKLFFNRMAEKSAKGSQIIFDHIFAMAVGSNRWNPFFRKWGTQFTWGIRELAELDLLCDNLERIHSRSLDATSMPGSWIKNVYEYFAKVPAHCVSIFSVK